jgi:hypothetical protein
VLAGITPEPWTPTDSSAVPEGYGVPALRQTRFCRSCARAGFFRFMGCAELEKRNSSRGAVRSGPGFRLISTMFFATQSTHPALNGRGCPTRRRPTIGCLVSGERSTSGKPLARQRPASMASPSRSSCIWRNLSLRAEKGHCRRTLLPAFPTVAGGDAAVTYRLGHDEYRDPRFKTQDLYLERLSTPNNSRPGT